MPSPYATHMTLLAQRDERLDTFARWKRIEKEFAPEIQIVRSLRARRSFLGWLFRN